MSTNELVSFLWATRLVRVLQQAGVEDFVCSPGFRNAPLCLALLRQREKTPSLQMTSHVDERGAAFFALGLAKSRGRPSAVICTSGTALANFHPAVLEARYARIPLVVISADRPQELIGIGANQTMKQKDFFSEVASLHFECPDQLSNATQARWDHMEFMVSKTISRGEPFHINMAFREPFLLGPDLIRDAEALGEFSQPRMRFFPAMQRAENLGQVLDQWSRAQRVLVVVGPQSFSWQEKESLQALARLPNTIVAAEAASGLPVGEKIFSRLEPLLDQERPQVLVRFGCPLTTKKIEKISIDWQKQGTELWVFDDRDPALGAASYFDGEALSYLANNLRISQGDPAWISRWQGAQSSAEKKLEEILSASDFSEWHVAKVWERLPEGARVFLGNSMPIRDFNHCVSRAKTWEVFSNRGLSGIDGLIGSALGMAYANPRAHNVAILGDLSAIHDLSSLSLAARSSVILKIFVINNNGGEIFRVVGTSEWRQDESWFTTPQNVDFSAIARGFGLTFSQVCSLEQLEASVSASTNGVELVEIVIDTQNNRKVRSKW